MKKNLFILSLLASISSVYSADFRKISINNLTPRDWNVRVNYVSGAHKVYVTDAKYQNQHDPNVMLLPRGNSVSLNIQDGAGINIRVFSSSERNFNAAGEGNIGLSPEKAQRTQEIDIDGVTHVDIGNFNNRIKNYNLVGSLSFDQITINAYEKKKNQ